jgi:hypothetical protein
MKPIVRLGMLLIGTVSLAFTLPAPRDMTPRELFEAPSKDGWVVHSQLTRTNALFADHFRVSVTTNAEGADFQVTVKSPLSLGLLHDGLLMLTDGNGLTNVCSVASAQDTNEVAFRTFAVARQCLPASRFQVWFYLAGENPVRARVFWFWLRDFAG